MATGPVLGPVALRDLPAPVRAVAVNAEGDAAVLIEPCATLACHPAAPKVLIRRHGHGFGRPVALDRPGRGYGAGVAIDPRGRVLAAWDRDQRVYARAIGIRGRRGRMEALGPEAAPSVFQVVLPGDGRAAVAWGSEAFGGAGAGPPFTATVALADAHGRFARHVLATVPFPPDQALGIPLPGVVVRLPANAPGVVAWTGRGAAGEVVRAATIRGTTLGSARTVSPPGVDTLLGDADAGPRGEAVVVTLPVAGPRDLGAAFRRSRAPRARRPSARPSRSCRPRRSSTAPSSALTPRATRCSSPGAALSRPWGGRCARRSARPDTAEAGGLLSAAGLGSG